MPEVTALFTFINGINTKNDPLALKESELQTCSGLVFDISGQLNCRPAKTAVNTSALSSIHTMHRYMNRIICGDGINARYKWDLTDFCDQYTGSAEFTLLTTLTSSLRWSVADYANFTFLTNTRDKKAIAGNNIYNWGIDAPLYSATGAEGSAGNPSGTYYLYYTYLVKFPNGQVIETAPSPSATVTTTTKAINWTRISTCPYTGTGLIIWRNLYRTISGTTYFVDSIKNNTTTTYTDDFTDAVIQGHTSLTTTEYYTPPDNMKFIINWLQRIFAIKDNFLFWSEAYMPFNFKWSSSIAISPAGQDLISIVPWGDQLYIPSCERWYRLQGTDPDSWNIKQTFSDGGIINGHTAKCTRYGILGLGWDGIYVFDGSTTRNISKKFIKESTFTNFTGTKESRDACFAEYDGDKYYFYYPSSGTTLNSCLVLDLSYYPEYRFYNDDFIATAFHSDRITGNKYLGKANGYQYVETGTETVATSLTLGEVHGGNAIGIKNLKYLYYDINTGGKNVTVTFYVDGVASNTTITLNHSSRVRKRINTPNLEGYRFYITLSCADSSGLIIYAPWACRMTTVEI